MAYEDFTTYTEEDPNSKITVGATQVSWNDLSRDEDAWVYKDHGVNHFAGDFTHLLEVQYSDSVDTPLLLYWGLSNDIQDFLWWINNAKDAHLLYTYRGDFGIEVIENGVEICDDETFGSIASTTYYITIARDDNGGANGAGQLTAEIRTGSHTGTLQETLTVDSHAGEQNDFRYLFACNTYNSAEYWNTSDGFTQNLDIGEAYILICASGNIYLSGTAIDLLEIYTLACASGNIHLSGTTIDLSYDIYGGGSAPTAKALNCGWRFNRNRSSRRVHSSKKIGRRFRGNCWK